MGTITHRSSNYTLCQLIGIMSVTVVYMLSNISKNVILHFL